MYIKQFLITLLYQPLLPVPSGPPSNTIGTALNSTHVSLSWDPPSPDQINGVIIGYSINFTELETGGMSHLTSEQTETVIGPLHPHYTYNFTVVAFTLVGSGPITYVIVRTDEDGNTTCPSMTHQNKHNSPNISFVLQHLLVLLSPSKPWHQMQHPSFSPGNHLHHRTRMVLLDSMKSRWLLYRLERHTFTHPPPHQFLLHY